MSFLKIIANGLSVSSIVIPVIDEAIYPLPNGKFFKISSTSAIHDIQDVILTDDNGNILTNENDSQLTGTK
jgi:hypothetical protein